MGVADYNTNPDLNTTINGINIAEGCPPSGINDAIRQLMADVKADKAAQDTAMVKTVNGTAPDAAGNITPAQTGCLPLAGGTMTGSIKFFYNGEVGELAASNFNSDYRYVILSAIGANSASFQAFMKDSPNFGGAFICHAMNANGSIYDLVGRNDGSLTWRDSPVLLPPGAVFAFAGNSVPGGCLICNGAAVSRTTYAELFTAIGTTYGAGNGSTTFNLPNLTDKFIQGSDTAGTVKSAGLPNLYGKFAPLRYGVTVPDQGATTGVFSNVVWGSAEKAYASTGQWGTMNELQFNATQYNSIYGNINTVQPPALTMRYYIKY